jgi:phosphatidylglycerol:prolipoprotein diacylglycerol transferase
MGWLFGVYLACAGAERFLVEFLRAKDDRLLAGFTLAQLASVLVVGVGLVLLNRYAGAGEVQPGAYLVTGKAAS